VLPAVTTMISVIRVLRSSGGGGPGGIVECASCQVSLRPVDEVDTDVALGTFLHHHPDSPEAVHRLDVPAGWTPVTALLD
jgi:hypothetical protein